MWYFGWGPGTEKGHLVKAKGIDYSLIIMVKIGSLR